MVVLTAQLDRLKAAGPGRHAAREIRARVLRARRRSMIERGPVSRAESAEAELAALRASERVMWMSPQGHLAPLPRGRNWRRVVVSVREDA